MSLQYKSVFAVRILSDEFLPLHLDTVDLPGSVVPTVMTTLPGSTFGTVEMAARTLKGTYLSLLIFNRLIESTNLQIQTVTQVHTIAE